MNFTVFFLPPASHQSFMQLRYHCLISCVPPALRTPKFYFNKTPAHGVASCKAQSELSFEDTFVLPGHLKALPPAQRKCTMGNRGSLSLLWRIVLLLLHFSDSFEKNSLLYFTNSFKKFDLVCPVKKGIDENQLSLEPKPRVQSGCFRCSM